MQKPVCFCFILTVYLRVWPNYRLFCPDNKKCHQNILRIVSCNRQNPANLDFDNDFNVRSLHHLFFVENYRKQ